jgi:hypothetical protein
MNYGGFSWKRLLGISAFKSRVSRKIGIPLTASGRRRKLGASIFNAVGPVAGAVAVAAIAASKERHQPNGPSHSEASASLLYQVSGIQKEAKEAAKNEGWRTTLVYFENAERGLYQIVLADNTEHVRQTLQEGMAQVGFIGLRDAPKGIKFGFSLDDRFPVNGTVAKRFVVNAREWIETRSKDLCAQKRIAAPVVHDFEFSKQAVVAQAAQNVVPAKPGITSFTFGFVIGIAGLFLALVTGEWRMTLVIVLFAAFTYGGKHDLLRRLTIAFIISLLLYQAWWAAGIVIMVFLAFLILRVKAKGRDSDAT